VPGDAVATGADGDQQVALAREAHRGDHIGHACAAGDAGRAAVDRAVPDLAGSVVTGARRQDELAAEGFRERLEVGGDVGCCCIGGHIATVGLHIACAQTEFPINRFDFRTSGSWGWRGV
jgi:hypothetical protein